MVTLTIIVRSKQTGQGLRGKRVSVGCDEFLTLWTSKRESTNQEGVVKFSTARANFKGKIYIDGKTIFQGKIQAYNEIYI